MTALTAGFAEFVLEYDVSRPVADETVTQLWSCPHLQLVDIQRFAGEPNTPPRFYLALSDSLRLVWGIALPGSQVEADINDFTCEVGCCISITRYAIVTASNGKNVVVIVSAVVAPAKLSLIGEPNIADYALSPQCLRPVPQALPTTGPQVGLSELWRAPQQAPTNWCVIVKVLWKSKLRMVPSNSTNPKGRFVFDTKVMGSDGVAAPAVFWGGRLHYEAFNAGNYIKLAGGSIRFDDSDPPQPSAMHFTDRSYVERIVDAQLIAGFPCVPSIEVGHSDSSFVSVAAALQKDVGDVVSFRGIVVQCGEVLPTSTRRGVVDRRSLTVRDLSSSAAINVTLWDEIAECGGVTVGTVWCFRNVSLRSFGTAKVASSRPSSEVFMDASAEAPSRVVAAKCDPLRSMGVTVGAAGTAEEWLMLNIEQIDTPLFYSACNVCSRQVVGGSCPQCGVVAAALRFAVRMTLGDGVSALKAVGYTAAGEALFGASSSAFLSKISGDPRLEAAAIRSLIGMPVTVQLSKGGSETHITALRHLHMAEAASHLLVAIATLFNQR